MADNFYTSVIQRGNYLLVRGIKDGKRVSQKIRWRPTFYGPTEKKSPLRTLQGQRVAPVVLESITEGRGFLERYKDQPDLISGFERYPFVYIAEQYPEYVTWDMDKILILTLDIEVACESGFPNAQKADEPLLCITVKNQSNKAIMVWGIADYNNDRKDVRYIRCDNEEDLLKKFLDFWSSIQPDIVTGWNVQFFDIPYLCNRIDKLFGEKEVRKLSPWGYVNEQSVYQYGRQQQKYDIFGVACLDYLDLYRKFTYINQESYRLDHIAFVELGERKEENPYETYQEWYTKDYQSFVSYNITDVELVDALEDKMKLIELALTVAYEAKVNYEDVYSQVKMWDVLIYNFLRSKNIVVPKRKTSIKDDRYEGAYVKEPQTGMHKWVMSFDLNSLYPHLIMQYNISPETLVEQGNGEVSVEKLLEKKVELPDDGCAVTPNGARFRKDFQGFLPQLMEKMYDDRVKFKKWTLEAKQKYEDTKERKYFNEISKYNNIQMARKIALNSAYGAIGNQYFRYYDRKMATAITTSGQLSIRWIENKVNNYLNKILSTTDKDYIIASDTDSIYVRFDELINEINPKNPVDFLDKVAREKIEPLYHQVL